MKKIGVSMRKLKEVLRLYYESDLSNRAIARSLNLSIGVVPKYIKQIKKTSYSWAQLKEMLEEDLITMLKPKSKSACIAHQIDFAMVHTELKRKGVTLMLLWEEYHQAVTVPDKIKYSRYCQLYRLWLAVAPISMRQQHKAGDKTFIDYSGMTMDIIDPDANEIRKAEVFIGVLGGSNLTYAEATWTQTMPDFIASHVNMFAYFGGVTNLLVPDNLKSAIHKPHRYDPDANPTYAAFAAHYGTAIMPARVRRPKDKSKAEGGVLLAQRWILARLRNQTFVGLHELNFAIRECLEMLNNKPFKKMQGSRRSLFEKLEKSALHNLPATPYVYQQYRGVRAGTDYHILLDNHHYSIPHVHRSEMIGVWFNHTIVKCYHSHKLIATHAYSAIPGGTTTVKEHMPKSHQEHSNMTPERLQSWAKRIGTNASTLIAKWLNATGHIEPISRRCLGVLRLANHYGDERFESVAGYALCHDLVSYQSIESVLKSGVDLHVKEEIHPEPSQMTPHDNVRGEDYYV